jgi:hypothetical protein
MHIQTLPLARLLAGQKLHLKLSCTTPVTPPPLNCLGIAVLPGSLHVLEARAPH